MKHCRLLASILCSIRMPYSLLRGSTHNCASKHTIAQGIYSFFSFNTSLSLRSGQSHRKWPLWDPWLLLVENYSNVRVIASWNILGSPIFVSSLGGNQEWKPNKKPYHSCALAKLLVCKFAANRATYLAPTSVTCKSSCFCGLYTAETEFQIRTFSAFWLRSSVVSVLISLISGIGSPTLRY
jgi:hypothetical protein